MAERYNILERRALKNGIYLTLAPEDAEWPRYELKLKLNLQHGDPTYGMWQFWVECQRSEHRSVRSPESMPPGVFAYMGTLIAWAKEREPMLETAELRPVFGAQAVNQVIDENWRPPEPGHWPSGGYADPNGSGPNTRILVPGDDDWIAEDYEAYWGHPYSGEPGAGESD